MNENLKTPPTYGLEKMQDKEFCKLIQQEDFEKNFNHTNNFIQFGMATLGIYKNIEGIDYIVNIPENKSWVIIRSLEATLKEETHKKAKIISQKEKEEFEKSLFEFKEMENVCDEHNSKEKTLF